MKTYSILLFLILLFGKSYASVSQVQPMPVFSDQSIRQQNGNGKIVIEGELKQWHKVTLTMDGPFAHELDKEVNPFTDYNMMVTFTHESGQPSYVVPGYFAADGNAGNTSADNGIKWRAHFSPVKTGAWNYKVSFLKGKMAAATLDDKGSETLQPYHAKTGKIIIRESNKNWKDFRAKGTLGYTGKRYLQFAGSKEYFLKTGSDAPETLLAYEDFDGTYTLKTPLKKYQKHIADWKPGDPDWKNGKGKGLIGAMHYLSGKGLNSFSFLTYNAGGDGDNIWPFVKRDEKYNYDCSRLDQWQVVFDYAQRMGLHCNFKTQETENDDNKSGQLREVKESLDGGELGPQRRLYYRELIARFSYLPALTWNLGEENTQTTQQQKDAAEYIAALDPYDHNIVVHTYPQEQEKVYRPLLGSASKLTGLSLQNEWHQAHQRTLQWVQASEKTGRPWVVANDEQGAADAGVPPDPGYPGFDGSKLGYDLHDIRKQTLWGNLMAGGAGVEYYFGYKFPENDLLLEDFRSRDQSWDYCRIATNFFKENKVPIQDMGNRNLLIGNTDSNKEKYCFAKDGELYLVYLAYAATSTLDLKAATGNFEIKWYNPRTGGKLSAGSISAVKGGTVVALGNPPAESGQDWLVVVTKK